MEPHICQFVNLSKKKHTQKSCADESRTFKANILPRALQSNNSWIYVYTDFAAL